MDMDYMDPYRRYAVQMQGYHGIQQQTQPQDHQYPYWSQHMVAYYQQHQQRAVMMGQGAMHMSKQTEPKPRLAKDEVELLEREFNKNPKPNSSTKRELAEQMGVEVPRINNWFQNRRAKEKQMRKTAEFEAQQAREKEASEVKESGDQEQGTVTEFYGLSNQHQPLGLSTAKFGGSDDGTDSDDGASGPQPLIESAGASCTVTPGGDTPVSPGSDYVHVKYEHVKSPVHRSQNTSDLDQPSTAMSAFTTPQQEINFQQPTPFSFRQANPELLDGLSGHELHRVQSQDHIDTGETSHFGSFPDRDYFASPPIPRFPSEMIPENLVSAETELLQRRVSEENLVKCEALSPTSLPESPLTVSDLRFKSPPPPADIAGRRKLRRPAPLGPSSLRGGAGPKAGIEAPRRSETASPMRRISSATGGLGGRVQKSFMGPGGPRSPFAMERNKEALLQSLQDGQSPAMASLNSAMSPLSPGGHNQSAREGTVGISSSDEEAGFAYGSLGAVGGFSMYKSEATMKTPPGTPGLQMGMQDAYFTGSMDHAWNFAPQDEPLPTPSLCSHGGSELEFSMAPQMPGYVASQPVTPSFPPQSMGPTYNGFFGPSLAQTEYHFPDSYATEPSARSSPTNMPRSKQFQFAQNITPQDFSADKS
ncbi:pah3 homeobox protein encoded by the pah3 gene [Podospora comata]|uniref:Pah3 homeobox protein encoded by the pah3 protein n=1 Tax=Podospora comata TaxID=48703 RepID=A0ABY6RX68_PODCO|nr:pah3 homeobox protein encoded by the pah3 gene [Podospora comata]